MTGFEPLLVDAATKSLTGIVIKTLWEGAGGFFGGIGKGLDEKRKQLIFNASKRYVENYRLFRT
ncbi:hypothetical protein [Argonema galeatum]|uniref:hypothetical protein n=1 Tax=Argonema galeatum TaxID=2942762 RepID=UPI002011F120|nr:hypothetical protein [Argonema galeatum]MCL1467512.1 hypothetical protein [Argonema galeatum A003/A1]